MRNFSARETEWLLELDGIELAEFWQRAIAFLIDWMIVGVCLSVVAMGIAMSAFAYLHGRGKSLEEISQMVTAKDEGKDVDIAVDRGTGAWHYRLDPEHSRLGEGIKIFSDVVVPGLYFGVLLWTGKGRTPGKRLMKIRVVSLMHRHITFWHSVERALGYGAAALEGGFGFVQFFIHPYRRCAQDRLAETIVVTERGYQAMQLKLGHPLIPDTSAAENAPE
jgi:uncharacterized RDD family membrane protein YckC